MRIERTHESIPVPDKSLGEFPSPFLYRLTRFTANLALSMEGVTHTGEENIDRADQSGKPQLYVPTHRGFMDILGIGITLGKFDKNVRFLAKQELFNNPFLGKYLSLCGTFPIDRKDVTPGQFSGPTSALIHGKDPLCIFAEQSIRQGGSVTDADLKTGFLVFALISGAIIVPCAVAGPEKKPRGLGLLPLHVHFEEPIEPKIHIEYKPGDDPMKLFIAERKKDRTAFIEHMNMLKHDTAQSMQESLRQAQLALSIRNSRTI